MPQLFLDPVMFRVPSISLCTVSLFSRLLGIVSPLCRHSMVWFHFHLLVSPAESLHAILASLQAQHQGSSVFLVTSALPEDGKTTFVLSLGMVAALSGRRVVVVDADLRRLIDDMFATMYDAPGIGLAAPQIGISRRLIVMDPSKDDQPNTPLAMVNPEILQRSDEMRTHEEGCLSIPEFTAEIERPAKTRVAYLDREGTPQESELEGIWSTLVQHEIDHLNGVLFIDYLSRLKRDMVVKKFKKQKRADAL